ncbi:hypothetical protein [Streptomyces sp. NPDC048106]|uniref:hypothetical protein n=1 Tax=Streptomyces sp. NPDC048106 TaxID=3155750 RepID=UPI0034538849
MVIALFLHSEDSFTAWPLVGANMPEPLVFQVLCQIAFAAYLMPAPLVPENWTARPRPEGH